MSSLISGVDIVSDASRRAYGFRDGVAGHIRNALTVVQRQLATLGVVLALGATLGVSVYVLTPERYEAVALVQIKPARAAGQGAHSHAYQAAILTELEKLRSGKLFEQLAIELTAKERSGLQSGLFQWFRNPSLAPTPDTGKIYAFRATMDLRAVFSIHQRADSPIVEVRAVSGSAEHAASLVNRIIALYMAERQDSRTAHIAGLRTELAAELEMTRARISRSTQMLGASYSGLGVVVAPELHAEPAGITHIADLMAHEVQLVRVLEQVPQSMAGGYTSSHVLSDARVRLDPTAPDGEQLALATSLASLVLGFVFVGLRDALGGGFSRDDEIEDTLGLAVAACIPEAVLDAVPAAPGSAPSVSELVLLNPRAEYTQSLRAARTEILLRKQLVGKPGAQGGGQVVMITSPAPGDGKTSIALSMGRTFAMSGYRTLVMDGDFRRPDLHRHINTDPPAGQDRFLMENRPDVALDGATSHEPESGLDLLLGSWQQDEVESRLLAAGRFHHLIDHARTRYDVVIVDTAPVLMTPDTQKLATAADVILLAVRRHKTPRQEVASSVRRLGRTVPPTTEIMAVLNHARTRKWARRVADVGFFTNQQ